MNLLPFACLLIASCAAAPSTSNNLDVTKNFFSNDFVLYTGQHDIVNIYVPLKQFNFEDPDYSSMGEEKHPYTIYFVEADIVNGKRTDKGLYVFKKGTTTKLLDNGRDAVASNEDVVYFGAKDGIYKYNEAENKAVKHGSVTDNIIQLAHNKKTNDIYYLTVNNEVFKLNSDATDSVKVSNLKNVQKLVFGFEGNLYYLDSERNVYVLDAENGENGVGKKVEDLPSGFKDLELVSPIYGLESGAFLVVDGSLYFLQSNATTYKGTVKFSVKPTAYAPQATLAQFYALDKKIYEFNIIKIMFYNLLAEVKTYLDDKTDILRKAFDL